MMTTLQEKVTQAIYQQVADLNHRVKAAFNEGLSVELMLAPVEYFDRMTTKVQVQVFVPVASPAPIAILEDAPPAAILLVETQISHEQIYGTPPPDESSGVEVPN